MYCKNCGEEIDDRAVVCIKCGVPTEIHPVNDEFSGISIAAIICAFFVPLAGFILGLIGMQNAKNQKSKSLAMAGIHFAFETYGNYSHAAHRITVCLKLNSRKSSAVFFGFFVLRDFAIIAVTALLVCNKKVVNTNHRTSLFLFFGCNGKTHCFCNIIILTVFSNPSFFAVQGKGSAVFHALCKCVNDVCKFSGLLVQYKYRERRNHVFTTNFARHRFVRLGGTTFENRFSCRRKAG